MATFGNSLALVAVSAIKLRTTRFVASLTVSEDLNLLHKESEQ